jgi:hypothetical protein
MKRVNCTVPGATDSDVKSLRNSASGEFAVAWQGHREAFGVDAGDDNIAVAGESQGVERRDSDLDASSRRPAEAAVCSPQFSALRRRV